MIAPEHNRPNRRSRGMQASPDSPDSRDTQNSADRGDSDAPIPHESADDLYDNAPCGYLSTTPDGVIIRVNQTFLSWTGYARDEVVGRVSFADLLRAGGKIYYETHVAPLLQMQGTAQEIALDLVTKERRLLPTLVSALQLRDATGRPLLHRLTVFNASDRRRYEQELLRAKAAAEHATAELQRSQAALATERDRLRQILDLLPVAVLLVDTAGQIVLTNAAARALLGPSVTAVSSAFLLGGPAGTAPPRSGADEAGLLLLRPDGTPYPSTEVPLQRALQAGEAMPTTEALLRLAHGERTLPILVSCAALHDGDVVSGAIAALQDITALKALDQAREEFLGAAAHDLKTPLTGIQGLAQLARRRLMRLADPQAAPILEQLEGIEAATRRMAALIGDLLDGTRLQLGALLELERRPTDLVALTRDVIGQRPDPGHRLVLQTEVKSLVATVDPERIAQVLDNLVGNALKYSPAGGQIVVRLGHTEEEGSTQALLAVQDAGLGIPAADLPHIFERYYRAGNVRGRIAGTGIGLASVRQIVDQHGGAVTVDSREGQGTTVTVRLPLAVRPGVRANGPRPHK